MHDELLRQALALMVWDESGAGARRAVSTAYYALFHLFVTEAVERMIPPDPVGLRFQARRAFTHSNMLDVCEQFAVGNLHRSTKPLIPSPIEAELAAVADDFRVLQKARHAADYDLRFVATQIWAVEQVGRAEAAFSRWRSVRGTPNATVFLVALALHRNWSRAA